MHGATIKIKIVHVCLSVRPHGTTPVPLNGFPLYLMYENFVRKSVDRIEVSLSLIRIMNTLQVCVEPR
jgi:hypothetical protein